MLIGLDALARPQPTRLSGEATLAQSHTDPHCLGAKAPRCAQVAISDERVQDQVRAIQFEAF